MQQPIDVAGYVLAGGRSTRMGQDKALLPLAGRPLIEHAVRKLQCLTAQVYILGSRADLARFAPLIPDVRENCGPLGGMAAALEHSQSEWVLILPVDVPFIPVALLKRWISSVAQERFVRVALFAIDDVAQPTVCMLHREVLPFLRSSLDGGRYKLYPALEEAARELAARQQAPLSSSLLVREWNERASTAFLAELKAGGADAEIGPMQWMARHLWFANLNTPEEFAEAERNAGALDL